MGDASHVLAEGRAAPLGQLARALGHLGPNLADDHHHRVLAHRRDQLRLLLVDREHVLGVERAADIHEQESAGRDHAKLRIVLGLGERSVEHPHSLARFERGHVRATIRRSLRLLERTLGFGPRPARYALRSP